MDPGRPDLLLRQLRRLVTEPGAGPWTDRELLRRFAAQGDQAAFADLVRRHGPMVLRVGRRLLHQDQDAEDVFQATFLTLARKAASPRWQASVASWLYQVAYHLSLKVKTAAARRQAREVQAAPRDSADPLEEVTGRELRAALDDELARLPEKYRAPLVLCYLEGATRDEAAQRLGWPLGTLKLRLEQGRALLRRRLTRRGLTLSAVLPAGLLAESAGQGAVPLSLAHAAVGVAGQLARGGAPAVSAEVAALSEAALVPLSTGRLRPALLLFLLVSAAALGAGAWVHRAKDATTPQSERQDRPPEAGPQRARPPRVDALGDLLPEGAVARLGSARLRQGGPIQALAVSPDGKLLATGGDYYGVPGGIHIWDPATGALARHWQAHGHLVHALAFLPDGKTLVSAGREPGLRLWDVERAREVGKVQTGEFGVSCLRLAPDGKSVFVGLLDHGISHHDLPGGRLLGQFRGHTGTPVALAVSPDGRTLASGSLDNTLRLWDAATGKEVRQLNGHPSGPCSLAFSPDGKALVSGGRYEDPTIRAWDVKSGRELRRWRTRGLGTSSLAFTRDGKTLASGGWDPAVYLWDPATGEERRRLDLPRSFGYAQVAFSADEKTLAVGGFDNTVHLWDLATGKERFPPQGHDGPVHFAAFGRDPRSLATASWDNTVRVWGLANGKEERRLTLPYQHRAPPTDLSPDGQILALGLRDGGKEVVALRDLAGDRTVRTLSGLSLQADRVVFAPDGRLVAACSSKEVCVWEAASGKEVRRFDRTAGAGPYLAFSPDGKLLAAAGWGNTVHLGDLDGGAERKLQVGGPSAGPLAFSPDGACLAVAAHAGHGQPCEVGLWDVASGQEKGRLRAGTENLYCLTFSPDGRALAGGGVDRRAWLWEAASLQERRPFPEVRGVVNAARFSADGRLLVTAHSDNTALVWDLIGSPDLGKPAALTARQLDEAWADLCQEKDAARAYRAMQALLARPDQAVPLLQERLPTGAGLDKLLARLIRDLDDDAFAVRERATRELGRLGRSAEAALRKALANPPSPEARRRLEDLVQKLEGPESLHEVLPVLRGVEVLERVGTAEARRLLEEFAKRAGSRRLVQEAEAALARLAKK